MKKIIYLLFLSGILISCSINKNIAGRKEDHKVLKKTLLMDKIKGGWAGQVIGCTYGGPTEFKYLGKIIDDTVALEWKETSVQQYFDTFPGLYDDLYMDMTFVAAIESYGVDAPVDSFANSFAQKGYRLWAANQVARYNILQGIKAPESGHWLNNPHADDIDFQIESDFIGLMYPGMPSSASKLADKIGHIMNYGDGWYGGVFVSNMYSLAFVHNDINTIVKEAIRAIPPQSDFYKCITDIINWHEQYPTDWKKTWSLCEQNWSNEVGSPDGVFHPYNIDAKLNSAYIVIGLLYGNGDFFRSMDISTRCGQDSDCNPSTVAGILGTLYGYSNIPERFSDALLLVDDRKFDFTDYALNDIYSVSYKHALERVVAEGGRIEDENVIIKPQPIQTVRYEKSFENHYPITASRKTYTLGKEGKTTFEHSFEGTGIVLRGNVKGPDDYVAKIDIYLDGNHAETINLPASLLTSRYQLFHKYQLPKRQHNLSFRWLNPINDAKVNIIGIVEYSDAWSHTQR